MKRKIGLALIQQALLRWENAVLIAMGILLTTFLPQPFDFWPSWGWAVLALIGVAAITISSLSESDVQTAAIDDMLYQEYSPDEIKTPALRTTFLQSLKYRRTIEQMIAATQEGTIKTRLSDLADKVNQWIGYIYQLVKMLDDYNRDPMLQKDPGAIQSEVARLQASVLQAANPAMATETRNLIDAKTKYLNTTTMLRDKMQTAAMQLDQSIASMATVYTQLKLLATRDLESVNTQAIDQDIDAQVGRMSDLIAGLQKVYREGDL
jgi:hypothetical protein